MRKGVVIAVAGVVLVAVAAVGGWWMFGRKPVERVAPAPPKIEKAAPVVVIADPVKRAEGIRAHTARFRHLWREASYIEVRQLASDGDALAQRRLSEIYEDCLAYAGPLRNNLEMLREFAKSEPASKPAIKVIYNDRNRLCMQAAADLRRNMKAGEYWLHRSAKGGDQVAEMRFFSRSVSTLSQAQLKHFLDRVRANGHPDAMFEMSLLLSRVDPRSTWPDATQAPALRGSNAELAWALAACRAGFDCSRGSRLMAMVCINALSCRFEDYERHLMSTAGYPPQRPEVEALIKLIDGNLIKPAP
ncbi:MAG: hypothetical protein JNM58_11855 [Xanthomonadaceae bacterium]|nr:hypothetical protein [Xanthomonadaceae bacterium]